MAQAQLRSARSATIEHARAGRERYDAGGEYLDALQRMVDLLRFSRIRLTALRVCVRGVGCGFAELLVRRALGHLGYAGMLGDGDVVFVHVADFGVRNEELHDYAVERELIGLLSRQLADLSANGPRVTVEISVAHIWSDEICNARGFVALLKRLVPRTDIVLPGTHQAPPRVDSADARFNVHAVA